MRVSTAKRVAARKGFSLEWDGEIKLYTLHPPEGTESEVSYHTKETLADINKEKFEEIYL